MIWSKGALRGVERTPGGERVRRSASHPPPSLSSGLSPSASEFHRFGPRPISGWLLRSRVRGLSPPVGTCTQPREGRCIQLCCFGWSGESSHSGPIRAKRGGTVAGFIGECRCEPRVEARSIVEPADGGRGISHDAEGKGRRLSLRQRRHRLRPDHRRSRSSRGRWCRHAQSGRDHPRDAHRWHGPRLLPRHRSPASGDGPRQRGFGQLAHGSHQCVSWAGTRPVRIGSDTPHRVRSARFAQRSHPLGPGDVRPGRSGSGVRQVGSRDPCRRADRRAGRSVVVDLDVGTERPDLPQPAPGDPG